MYLPLYKVADTPFYIEGDEMLLIILNSNSYHHTALQSQKAVSASLKSKQMLPFDFARQYSIMPLLHIHKVLLTQCGFNDPTLKENWDFVLRFSSNGGKLNSCLALFPLPGFTIFHPGLVCRTKPKAVTADLKSKLFFYLLTLQNIVGVYY